MQQTSHSTSTAYKSKALQPSRTDAAIQDSISKKFKRLKSNHEINDP